jgi:hypothetical protein
MAKIIAAIINAWNALPTWARKAARDAVLGAIAAVAVLNLGIPGSLDQAKAEALTAITAAALAVLAIIRVEVLPPLLAWILAQLGLVYTARVGTKPPQLVKG